MTQIVIFVSERAHLATLVSALDANEENAPLAGASANARRRLCLT